MTRSFPIARLLAVALTLALSLALVLPATATSVSIASPTVVDDDAPYAADEVVVKLVSATDLASVAADFALQLPPLDQFGSRPIYRLRILDGSDPQAKADALVGAGRAEYAEPNFLVRPPEWQSQYSWAKVDSPGRMTSQWAPGAIDLPEAHATGAIGAGQVVAVLDTGVDAAHPRLSGRVLAGWDFVDMDADASEGEPAGAAWGHGTHVAGLVTLAAPGASVLPVRVLDANGAGNVWVLAEGIAFAANPDGDPGTPDGVDVINLSLSTQRRTALLDEVVRLVTCIPDEDDDGAGDDDMDVTSDDDADEGDDEDDDEGFSGTRALAQLADDDDCLSNNPRGIVVVAAAGNSGTTAREYPAAEPIPGLLAVAGTTRTDRLATFSTRGGWVHLAAPGKDIVSAMPGGGYAAWSGTSMAAGLVSGAAAVVRAQQPAWDPPVTTQQLIATSDPIPGSVPRRIDVYAAVAP